jgi:hypothetical protein
MTGTAAAPLVPRGLLPGVATLLVGAVFLADSLGMLDTGTGWAIWPIAVIVAGVAVRLQPGVASRVVGVVVIVAGIWLLFNEIGIWTYSFWRTWPLILILLGAWMRYRTWHMQHLAAAQQVGAFVFLSQVTRRTTGRVRGGELSALAGDGTFDFGGAIPSSEPIVLDAFVIAGRIRVAVPSDWTVEMRVLPVPGRVSDARGQDSSDAARRNADLIVQGAAILGIVEVIASTATPQPAIAAI